MKKILVKMYPNIRGKGTRVNLASQTWVFCSLNAINVNFTEDFKIDNSEAL